VDWNREISRLIADGVPESRVLEFKQALHLETSKQKRDVLADLSGMANGGGGVVIYGIAEREGDDGAGVADHIQPITDATLLGRLVDLIRDTLQPPLLIDTTSVPVDGGHVLAIDLTAPMLGPHMVEFKDESRYYTRIGTSIVRMNEQQVRNAYALAARRSERRSDVWNEHQMPPQLKPGAWLTISVVPMEPLSQRFRAADVSRPAFSSSAALSHQSRASGIAEAVVGLRMWAHGLAGSANSNGSTDTAMVRVHEDGAVTSGCLVDKPWTITSFARTVNGMLAWASRVLKDLHVNQTVEVLVRLDKINLTQLLTTGPDGSLSRVVAPHYPAGIDHLGPIDARRELSAHALTTAGVRHDLVREFIDRISAAFVLPRTSALFATGALFDRDGSATGKAAMGHQLYGDLESAVYLYDDGAMIVGHNSRLVGHLVEGVLLDSKGDCLAVTELATGVGCPPNFLAQEEGRGEPHGQLGQPSPRQTEDPQPAPTGNWSPVSFHDHLAAARSAAITI